MVYMNDCKYQWTIWHGGKVMFISQFNLAAGKQEQCTLVGGSRSLVCSPGVDSCWDSNAASFSNQLACVLVYVALKTVVQLVCFPLMII